MGIRAIFHQLERDEIRALPYVSAGVRTKIHQEELEYNRGTPPTVKKTPKEWRTTITGFLVLYHLSVVWLLIH